MFGDRLVLVNSLIKEILAGDDLVICHFNLSTEKSTVFLKALFLQSASHPFPHRHTHTDYTGEASRTKIRLATEGTGDAKLPALQDVCAIS